MDSAAAQNRYTSNFQAYGDWVFQYAEESGISTRCGKYIIKSVKDYQLIDTFGNTSLTVRSGKRSENINLYPFERSGDSISVRHGVWTSYDPTGRLRRIDSFADGVHHSGKEYESHGRLVEEHRTDYDNNTSCWIRYHSGRMFNRSRYGPENENQQVADYYPEDALSISDAEPYLRAVIGKLPGERHLRLRARSPLILASIDNSIPGLQIRLSRPLPTMLQAGDTMGLKMMYAPNSADMVHPGRITLISEDPRRTDYPIFCSFDASHIDGSTWNSDSVQHLRLSRMRDMYFVTSPNKHARVFVRKEGMKTRCILGPAASRLSLAQLDCGTYELEVWAHESSVTVELELVE